jgi:hypothetical protein
MNLRSTMKMGYCETTPKRHRNQWFYYQKINNRVKTTSMESQIRLTRTVEVMSLKPVWRHKWCANVVKLKLWHGLLEHRHYNKHANLFHVSSLFFRNFDFGSNLGSEKIKRNFLRETAAESQQETNSYTLALTTLERCWNNHSSAGRRCWSKNKVLITEWFKQTFKMFTPKNRSKTVPQRQQGALSFKHSLISPYNSVQITVRLHKRVLHTDHSVSPIWYWNSGGWCSGVDLWLKVTSYVS